VFPLCLFHVSSLSSPTCKPRVTANPLGTQNLSSAANRQPATPPRTLTQIGNGCFCVLPWQQLT